MYEVDLLGFLFTNSPASELATGENFLRSVKALRPCARRGGARRDTVEHRDHVLDLGPLEALRDEHNLAATVGVGPPIEPSQLCNRC